jgi:hypothetical protein
VYVSFVNIFVALETITSWEDKWYNVLLVIQSIEICLVYYERHYSVCLPKTTVIEISIVYIEGNNICRRREVSLLIQLKV